MKNTEEKKRHHPGSKLREVGAHSLTDAELLAILIGTGAKGKTAEDIAKEILEKFGDFKGMATQSFEEFLKLKSIRDVKVTRITSSFGIAKRIVKKRKRVQGKRRENDLLVL